MSVTLNAGSGGATLGTDTVTGTPNVDYQIVKIGYSVAASAPTQVSASNPLPVAVNLSGTAASVNTGTADAGTQRMVLATNQPSMSNAQPVTQSGAWTVTVNGVVADATAFTRGTTLQLPVGGVVEAAQSGLTVGQARALSLTTGALLRVDASGVAVPVTGTFWQTTQPVSLASIPALPAHQSTNVDQINGTTPDTNSGVKSAGTLRVVLATDQPQLTNKLLVTPDSVALPAHQSVNVDQLNGTATDTNSGNKSAGTLRVVIATDQPSLTNAQPVTQSGTWTVQPGNTANTTPWLTTNIPGTSPGSTVSRIKAAASTNSTNLKGSAGVVLGYALYNNTASAKFFKFYNKATAPTVGTDTPLFTVIVPASGGANVNWADGLPFGTGIGYGITGAVGDSDTTNTAVDDVHGMVLWK